MSLSKSDIKRISALKNKKYRVIDGLFVAEGQKIILDLISAGFVPQMIVTTEKLLQIFQNSTTAEIKLCASNDMDKISSLKQSPGCLAVFQIPQPSPIIPTDQWILAVDGLQDPGNMGTILRTADWFGIRHLICSPECVDVYNPKVVQATMGSIARVQVHYTDLEKLFSSRKFKIYAGLLEGDDMRTIDFSELGMILLGNESKGISDNLLPYISQAVKIPNLGGAESLNVGVATGIMVYHALLSR